LTAATDQIFVGSSGASVKDVSATVPTFVKVPLVVVSTAKATLKVSRSKKGFTPAGTLLETYALNWVRLTGAAHVRVISAGLLCMRAA
jgi:hypothetical protein